MTTDATPANVGSNGLGRMRECTWLDLAKTKAADDVLQERVRQVTVEGWTAAHDDEHDSGEMAKAAACYALQSAMPGNQGDYLRFWPAQWDSSWWRPKDKRRDLVRAAALLLAEIERLDRAA